MVATDGLKTTATRFHCINCGMVWGDGIDVNSYGVCPDCFSKWAKMKKTCFGDVCDNVACNFSKFCSRY